MKKSYLILFFLATFFSVKNVHAQASVTSSCISIQKEIFKILALVVVLFFFAGCKKEAPCTAIQGDWELVN